MSKLIKLLMLFSLSIGMGGYASEIELNPYEGKYFRILSPQGWHITENSNAIEVSSSDGVTGYSFILLMGAFGYMDPKTFLLMRLQNADYQQTKILSLKNLPDQPGPMGIPWKAVEAEVQYVFHGTLVKVHVVSAVLQGSGQYSGVMRAYQSPATSWQETKHLLATIDNSLLITNPREVAGLDKVQLPKGTSHDELYGSYNRAREKRERDADARLSKQRHEATMEYERMKDPNTGQYYDMPSNQYDPTVGGYRNPNDPTQLLVPAAPGE